MKPGPVQLCLHELDMCSKNMDLSIYRSLLSHRKSGRLTTLVTKTKAANQLELEGHRHETQCHGVGNSIPDFMHVHGDGIRQI